MKKRRILLRLAPVVVVLAIVVLVFCLFSPVYYVTKVSQTYNDGSVSTMLVDFDPSEKTVSYTLNSSKQFFTFDDFGNVLTFTDQSTPSRNTTYQYDDHGNLISENNDPNHYYDYTYDENGILVKKQEYMQGALNKVWIYDSNGNLIEEDGPEHFVYTYDEQNLLSAEYEIVDGEQTLRSLYTYNEKGQLLQSSHYENLENGTQQLSSTVSYTYNARGKLVGKYKDSGKNDYENSTWTYDKQGRLTSFTYETKQTTQVHTWSYNIFGKLWDYTITKGKGSLTTSTKFAYGILFLSKDSAAQVQALQDSATEALTTLIIFKLPEMP